MRSRYLPISFATLLFLCGCTVGPRHVRPDARVPGEWIESGADNGSVPSSGISRWWTMFHDPVLDSLVERAVHKNLDARIAGARIREVRSALGVAAAGGLPRLDASASSARGRRSEIDPPARSKNLFQAGFDSSWEIDVFGGIRRDVEAAKADIAAAEESRRDVVVTLLAEVARNYIELRGSRLRIAILKSNLEAQRETLGLTKVRFDAGLATELDVARAETLVATTRARLPALDAEMRQVVHRLGVLLGEPPGALRSELSADSPIPLHPPVVPVGLPSEILRRRPDIRRAERELESATARIGVATAELFPRFSLTGSFGGRSDRLGDLTSGNHRFREFGPSVRWPIFAGGRIRANIQATTARQEQALALYEKAVLTSLEEVENALVSYSRERERRLSLFTAVTANRRAVELARSRYSGGLDDFLSVLDAQRSLYDAEDRLALSDQSVAEYVVRLYKALGGGWERSPG
ncbi:MAG: efflux transporter outer membrane subunit [Deltaproteobacteria bacterium]|nr:efflux transporter outer membrane subunit [Deltaproteobacteria bacterium]